MRKYRIQYWPFQGSSLTFTVSEYEIIEGDFIQFTDEKTGKVKRLHSSRCEITEVQQ